MQPTRLVLIFIGLMTTFLGKAQNMTDSIQNNNKWEIGIDLLGLIDKNKVPKASIFVRRNYGFRDNKCKALRFRIGADTEKRIVKNSWDYMLLDDYVGYSPYLSIGHEWKTNFPKYRWFFGADAVTSFSRSDQYFWVGSTTYYDETIRDYTVGLNGFAGFQWKMTKFLSISLESALTLKYMKKYLHTIGGTFIGGDNGYRLSTKIEPIMVLNLIYSLQKHKKNVKK